MNASSPLLTRFLVPVVFEDEVAAGVANHQDLVVDRLRDRREAAREAAGRALGARYRDVGQAEDLRLRPERRSFGGVRNLEVEHRPHHLAVCGDTAGVGLREMHPKAIDARNGLCGQRQPPWANWKGYVIAEATAADQCDAPEPRSDLHPPSGAPAANCRSVSFFYLPVPTRFVGVELR